MNNQESETPKIPRREIIKVGTAGIIILSALLVGCPQYTVFLARKHGQAQLANATYSKEVAVATARAKMESADYEARADTIRAHGVARSNAIIGESLRNNQAYLYWLWIDHIEKANVIYIPTEGNMPILEAGKRNDSTLNRHEEPQH